jgi:hypothetical protein
VLSISKNTENKFELYNTSSGLKIFDEVFDDVQSFGNLFVVIKGEFKSIVHISGKPLLKSLARIQIEHHHSTNSLLYLKNKFCGITTQDGHHLSPICNSIRHGVSNEINNSFQFIVETIDGSAIWDSKKGFLKKFFVRVSPPILNLYVVRYNRKEHLIDFDFNFLITNAQSIVIDEDNGRIIRKQSDLADILDINLNPISTGFMEVNPFLNGYSVSKKNNQCGIINVNGDWIKGFKSLDMDLNCDHTEGLQLNEFITIKKDNLYGFFSTLSNNHVKPFSVKPIEFLVGYAIIQTEEDKYGLMDSKFNWVLPPQTLALYLCVDFFIYESDLISKCGFPYIAVHFQSLNYGLISYDGQWITEPNYDMIYDNQIGSVKDAYLFYLKFDKGEKKGVINIFGEEIFCEKIEWLWESELDDDYINFINNYNEPLDFKLKEGNLFSRDKIPIDGVWFPVIKEGVIGFYNAHGVFHPYKPLD